jgi:sec-independent protein translocase protein TatC
MLSHLLELRKRTLHVTLIFFCLFLLCFYNANELFHTLVKPLLQVLPAEDSLIATQITSPVLTPIKLAADLALLGTLPFALVQLWLFIAPGLYKQERFRLKTAIISSLLLFCSGVLFCFYLILPLMFQLFSKAVPMNVRLMPDIIYALDFITRMLLLFGLCFQVPILCVALIHLQWLDLQALKRLRPYVIVTAFILGMLLTPDVFSQTLLALPLWLLYELGLVLAALRR